LREKARILRTGILKTGILMKEEISLFLENFQISRGNG